MNYGQIIVAIENALNCTLTGEQCEKLIEVIDEYVQKDEVLRSQLEELEDEEEIIERQREHWEERVAIERDYIQLW